MSAGSSGLKDPWFWGALALALTIRLIPIVIWPDHECTRDECIFRSAAFKLLAGKGMMETTNGWLPAPGYPLALAACKALWGSVLWIKPIQVALGGLSTWMIYRLAARTSENPRVPRAAALLYALHPTLAFFTGTLWTETFYSTLLIATSLALLWTREGGPARGAAVGVGIGAAMLFRGAAMFLLPIFLLALFWPEVGPMVSGVVEGAKARWRHGLAMVAATFLFVAPYSTWASLNHGGFVVTDATIGHVMYLGNNDYPPLTFDYGNGILTPQVYARWLRVGRPECPRTELAAVSDKCEVDAARAWAMENPGLFVSRIPMRMAQLFNPNTFLTRHLRWGFWPGLPWELKEFLVIWTAAWSYLVVIGGTLGATARLRGPLGVAILGTVLYHVATVGLVYGMSRFRLPLEALWILYLAPLLAEPKAVFRTLVDSPGRAALALALLPGLTILTSWYLELGWPGIFY